MNSPWFGHPPSQLAAFRSAIGFTAGWDWEAVTPASRIGFAVLQCGHGLARFGHPRGIESQAFLPRCVFRQPRQVKMVRHHAPSVHLPARFPHGSSWQARTGSLAPSSRISAERALPRLVRFWRVDHVRYRALAFASKFAVHEAPRLCTSDPRGQSEGSRYKAETRNTHNTSRCRRSFQASARPWPPGPHQVW